MDLSKHAFFEGKIIPLSEAKVSIAAHAFLYGTSIFGGMRAFWNEEKQRLFIFRPYDHFRRLLHSAKMLSMKTEFDEIVAQFAREVFRKRGFARTRCADDDDAMKWELRHKGF